MLVRSRLHLTHDILCSIRIEPEIHACSFHAGRKLLGGGFGGGGFGGGRGFEDGGFEGDRGFERDNSAAAAAAAAAASATLLEPAKNYLEPLLMLSFKFEIQQWLTGLNGAAQCDFTASD